MQITTLDQVHQIGVLGVLTNVVPIRPSQQKDGIVGVIQFLSVHKRIKIDEPLADTKRLVAKISELAVSAYMDQIILIDYSSSIYDRINPMTLRIPLLRACKLSLRL